MMKLNQQKRRKKKKQQRKIIAEENWIINCPTNNYVDRIDEKEIAQNGNNVLAGDADEAMRFAMQEKYETQRYNCNL